MLRKLTARHCILIALATSIIALIAFSFYRLKEDVKTAQKIDFLLKINDDGKIPSFKFRGIPESYLGKVDIDPVQCQFWNNSGKPYLAFSYGNSLLKQHCIKIHVEPQNAPQGVIPCFDIAYKEKQIRFKYHDNINNYRILFEKNGHIAVEPSDKK